MKCKKSFLYIIGFSILFICCSSSFCSKYGHHFFFWETTKEPTCTEEGVKQRECIDCHYVEVVSIPSSHSYNDGVMTKQPTCTEKGIKTYTCTICNEIKDEEIPATGHSSKYKCSKCNTLFVQINGIGTSVIDSKGLNVKVVEWTKTSGTDFDTYYLRYEIKNNVSNSKLTPGTFAIVMSDDTLEEEYGFFNDLYTGDTSNRTYTWKILHNQSPILLKYEDVFASERVPLFWDVP